MDPSENHMETRWIFPYGLRLERATIRKPYGFFHMETIWKTDGSIRKTDGSGCLLKPYVLRMEKSVRFSYGLSLLEYRVFFGVFNCFNIQLTCVKRKANIS